LPTFPGKETSGPVVGNYDLEHRLETESRDRRKLTVTNAKISISGSTQKSDNKRVCKRWTREGCQEISLVSLLAWVYRFHIRGRCAVTNTTPNPGELIVRARRRRASASPYRFLNPPIPPILMNSTTSDGIPSEKIMVSVINLVDEKKYSKQLGYFLHRQWNGGVPQIPKG